MNSAVTDPQALFASLRTGTEGAIGSIFPIVGQKHRLELAGFRLGADPNMRDVRSQLQAKLDEQTWGAPLMAKLVLRDNQTGKVKDQRDIPVAMIPKMTATRGFIVDGKEYYVDYLWKTKPGIYVEQKARGVVASIPHPSRRSEISFDPAKREFKFHVGTTSVPIQPVLTALGFSQTQMAKAWGPEIAKANEVTAARARTAFMKLQRALGRPVMDNPDQLREILSEVELDPEVTKKTIGQPFRKLTPDAMFLAATKALHIARGNAKPDDRDNLRFKELIGLDDQVTDRVASYAKYKARSFKSAVDRHDSIENIVRPYTFHYPIHTFFNRSALSQLIDQTSPIDMLRASTRSSIAGEGMSMHALEHGETRTLNPSHMAFLDPIDTPEGSRTGVNLQLALGVMKDGRLPKTLVYDPRKKKYTYITPDEFNDSIVALPDQYRKKGKSLIPIGKRVKAAGPNNDLLKVSPSKVDYVIPNPGLLLGLGTALVPFAGNTSPGRLEMAARHMSQAIPLVSREAPLVQVAVAADDTKHSYESALAREHLPVAPVSGKVTSVSDDMIRIKDKSGRLHEVPLYRYYPLMGKREVLNEKPTVKVGQKVTAGQVLGDNNYTRNGTLALGTNLFSVRGTTPIFWFRDGRVVRRPIGVVDTSGPAEAFSLGVNDGRPVRLPVRRYLAHRTDQRMLRVRTWTGRQVDVTVHHSLVTIAGDGRLVEIKAEDAAVGTFLPRLAQLDLPQTEERLVFESRHHKRLDVFLDEDLGWLIGMYLAEGNPWPSRGPAKALSIAVTAPELVDRLHRVVRKICGPVTIRKASTGRAWLIYCSPLAQGLSDLFGSESFSKHLPDVVWNSPVHFRRALLGGYLDGDGTATKDVVAFSRSKDLRDGMSDLCLSLGIDTTLVCYTVEEKPMYGVRVANRHLGKLPALTHSRKQQGVLKLRDRSTRADWHDMIPLFESAVEPYRSLLRSQYGGRLPKTKAHLYRRGYVNRSDLLRTLALYEGGVPELDRLRQLAESPVCWDRIRSVEDAGFDEWVFDLDMGENPNFAVSNGLVVHNTALLPMPGRTFEDALVVSEGASKKLTSEHMYKFHASPVEVDLVEPKKFQAYYPSAYDRTQLAKIDKSGVVKPGTEVKPGDPLILALREQTLTNEAMALKKMHRVLAKPYLDASTTWDSDYPGKVVRVHRTPEGVVKVHVAVQEPLEVGDKLCYSEDTEVLTRRGWVPIARLTLDDEIATRAPDGSLVYQEPDHIDRFPHDGLMYHVRTQQLDLLVTPDHQMYVRPRGEADFRLIKARDIMGKRVEYQKGANWRQPDSLNFKLPSVTMTMGSHSWSTGELDLPMDPWVEFLGYFGADGYVNRNKGNYTVVIVKDRVRYPGLYKRIVEVIGELGYKPMQHPDRILFNSKQMFCWLETLGKRREKRIPEFVRGLSPRQIRLYLSAYQACDGHQDRKGVGYITADSLEMAGVVQELCLKAGWAGNIQRRDPETEMFSPVAGRAPYARAGSPSWVVQLVKSKLTPAVNHGHTKKQSAQTEELVSYTGFVYCCEVPNHVLYVRRNGKPVFCGNTTRHGVKGVVVDIRPDSEMPKTKGGRTIELAINPHGVACYDDRTEILTSEGWVPAPQISLDHVFATVRPGTLELEFQPPDEIHHLRHHGKMYRLINQQLDLMVTPNHNLFTAPCSDRIEKHADLNNETTQKSYRLLPAEDTIGHRRRFLKAARWSGAAPVDVVIAEASRLQGQTGPYSLGFRVSSLMWAEFLGWYLAKGSTYEVTGTGQYRVHISQSRKTNPEKYREICDLLDRMGLSYSAGKNDITITNKALFETLKPLGRAHEKRIPREILGWPAGHLQALLTAYIKGDGYVRSDRGDRASTTSAGLADDLQELALRLGMSANITFRGERVVLDRHGVAHVCRPQYVLVFSHRCVTPRTNTSPATKRRQVEEWVEYDGWVHCAAVPNGTLVVRRNGKIVVCGNSRMAAGQIYEMASAKIAEKRGKPIRVPNFLPETDYGETTREALNKLGVPDQDEIVDPTTGKTIGKALTGPSYVLKQRHQVDRKMAARAAGPGFSYDVNRQPKGGGETGGQSLGGLGNMALLAHGARSLLRESHTFKVDADQADEMWRAIQTGAVLPPPKLTFAHRKFQDYVRALGVNMEKKGSRVKLIPMTDKEVIDSTRGELKRPGLMFRASDMAPEEGGLFDPFVTGGIQGEHAARITLAEKLPNPFLERGVMALTGLKQQELRDIIAGKSGIVSGVVVDRKTPGAVTGSKAIEKMLSSIDPKKEMKALQEKLPSLSGAELDKASRRYRYLKALLDAGFTNPADAYMTKHLYVPPPSMRPVQILASGAIIRDSINELYKGVGIMNERLKDAPVEAPESRKGRTRLALYDAVGAAMGTFAGGKSVQGAEMHGALDVLTGVGSPKYSWFQSKLLKGRQDLSARSTIVPNPDLTIDEIGIPRPIANAVYRPFIVRELNRLGYAPLEAQELIRKNDPLARTALERVMQDRPLLMKRDPVLHKYGVMAFRPRIVGGRAIHVPPLITASMGADFDGDAVSLYAPVTNKAVGDAKRMFPSENLLNPSTGRPVFTPSNEMNVGLYRLSLFGKDTGREYKTVEEAAKAVAADKLDLTDVVTIAGKKTTVGRLLVHRALPEPARDDRLISDPNYTLTSKRVDELLLNTAKKDPGAYAAAAQKLMNLGNAAIYDNLFSISIKDFKPDKETRRKYFEAADREVARILASKDPEREQKAIARWARVGQEMMAEHIKKPGTQVNNLWVMSQAGVKPSPIQYQQITMAPVLMTDAKGNPILAPVDRSYSEGMDTAGFWLTSLGARTALIKKGIEVREPGYLNKQMVATVGNQVVVSDALPKEGIAMDVDHPDVVDRYLVEPVKTAKFNLKRGTLLTPEIVDRLKNARVSKVVVASPLTSPHGEGISAKAYGLMPNGQLPEIGENIGVMAGQSIGERLAQLMLKATHLGGVYEAGAGSSAVNQIRRIKELLRIPREIPNPAVLSPVDGKVSRITQDPAGGWNVTLSDSRGRESDHYVPGTRKLQVAVGQDVKKGRPITDGDVNLHELLDIGGVDQVRKQIVNELDGIFRPLGIRRRNIEVLAKGVTNTAVVEDPGDAHDLVRGQYVNLSAIRELNATRLKGKKPVKVTPVLSGISSAPLDNTEDWLNKMNHERLRESMVDAALEGHVSDISGYNPYSAMAFNERFGEGISKKPGAY